MMEEITPHLVVLPDGISEFTFVGLYLFRNTYAYKVSQKDDLIIISGSQDGKTFFITPCCSGSSELISELFQTHDYWKLISESFIQNNPQIFTHLNFELREDRDNFDYIYLRTDLATLSGKKFHKKKNHVNAFQLAYPEFELRALTSDTKKDAIEVLDYWASKQENPEKTDYYAAKEALELLEHFKMKGSVLYVKNTPIAWCLAEPIASGKMVAVHFEKARTDFRGAYQYINYAFAQSLSENFEFINREQDLGDEGMRQAKMSYRPCGFVKKYKIEKR